MGDHGALHGAVVKNLPANAGDVGSIPGSERSLGGGYGNPLQYSCLGIPVAQELGGLQSVGSDIAEHICAHTPAEDHTRV